MGGIEERSVADQAVTEAIAAQRPGHALSQEFYADPAIFERDMTEFVLKHWHCAGHASMVAEPGDFFTFRLGAESVIVVRGADREIRALVNVCRHRGSRVCTEAQGRAQGLSFACPYHAWTYGLDGSLRAARQMPEDFDKSQHGLTALHCREIEGLIFVSFAETMLGLAHVEEVLRGTVAHYGWADAKVAHRQTYPVRANWKLAVENYMECYHCQPAHQEYSRFHVFARPPALNELDDAQLRRRTRAMGLEIAEIDRWGKTAEPGQEAADSLRSALREGAYSGSEDGGPVAPLMGRFTDYDGGVTFIDIGPTSTFLAYPDHGLIYRFVPLGVQETEMEVIWLVRGDAEPGRDYESARLTWLWQVTSVADKKIIELNQQGVNSAHYRPGPYAPMEFGTQRLVEWYLGELA